MMKRLNGVERVEKRHGDGEVREGKARMGKRVEDEDKATNYASPRQRIK